MFRWIEETSLSVAIRQSTWLYPFVEIIHILGIVLVAGGAILFDLRLLTGDRHSITGTRYLLSWSKRGLTVAIPSGLLLFSTNAVALSDDPVFGLKLILLLIAALNAWIFHVRVYLPYRQQPLTVRWNVAKANAAISIVLWVSIISCGRLLAY